MCTISANAVRDCSYENFYTKIYHTKVSLSENFQIYGTVVLALLPMHEICTIVDFTSKSSPFSIDTYTSLPEQKVGQNQDLFVQKWDILIIKNILIIKSRDKFVPKN